MFLSRVTEAGRTLTFRRPPDIQLEIASYGPIMLFWPDTGVVVTGKSFHEALHNLSAHVFWVWDNYAQRPDDELASGGQELKRKLLDMLSEEVRPDGCR